MTSKKKTIYLVLIASVILSAIFIYKLNPLIVVSENPLSSNILTFNQAGGQTIYFKVPKDSTPLEAKLNLTGKGYRDDSVTYDVDNEIFACTKQCSYSNPCDDITYSGCPFSGEGGLKLANTQNCADENWDTYCGIEPTLTSYTANAWHYENFGIPPFMDVAGAVLTLKYHIASPTSFVAVIDAECDSGWGFSEVENNIFQHVIQSSNSGIKTVNYEIPINCVNYAKNTGSLKFEFRLRNGNKIESFAKFYESSVKWIGKSYPKNLYLEVGTADGIHEWDYAGEFSQSNFLTNDFSDEIRSFLLQCSIDIEGYCNVPLIFHSDSHGILEASMFYKECINNAEKCFDYNYYLCEQGLWKDKGEVPGKCGIVPCSTNIDCPKSSCNGKYYQCEIGICKEFGVCIEGPKPQNLWDMIQNVWNDFWNFIKGLF